MKYLECMIAWTGTGCPFKTATEGQIKVEPWPDETGWSDAFEYTCGACDLDVHRSTP